MTRVCWTILACMLGTASLAQTLPESQEAARERIQRERERAQVLFQAEDRECQQKFAVTDCSRKVERRRREHAAELRSEEDALNDVDRQRRALQAMREREQRALERASREAGPSNVSPAVAMPEAAVRAVESQAPKVKEVTGSPKASAISPEQAMRNKAGFEAKQKALLERQAAREKRLQEAATRKPQQPLPPAPEGAAHR